MLTACVLAVSLAVYGASAAGAFAASASWGLAPGWSGADLSSQLPANAEFRSVSCASASFCAAVATGATASGADASSAFTYNGQSWHPSAIEPDLSYSSLSCPSNTFCVALANGDDVLVYDGSRWSAPTAIDPPSSYGISNELTAVSCPTVSFCMAVDQAGNALTYNGSTWSKPTPVPDAVNLDAVTCVSASFCMTNEYQAGDVFLYDGTTWKDMHIGHDLTGVSCASSTFCLAVDETDVGQAMFYNGTSWSKPVTIDRSYQDLNALSCASASFCIVGGDSVNLKYDGKTWSPTIDIAIHGVGTITPVRTISCPSNTFCAALTAGQAYTYHAPVAGGSRPGAHGTCAGLRASRLQICRAQQTYRHQLASCDRRYAGTSKTAKARATACRRKARSLYRRAVALIHCTQIKTKYARATCIARAGKVS